MTDFELCNKSLSKTTLQNDNAYGGMMFCCLLMV